MQNSSLLQPTETILERADFNLQLLMFVTAEKVKRISMKLFLSSFVTCCACKFKLGHAECVQTTKAQTNRPRSQLSLMKSLYCSPFSFTARSA